MKRTHLLIAVALTGLAAALLLPKLRQPPGPTPAVKPSPKPAPLQAGSLSFRARPARNAFLASGDEFDVVYEISAASAPDSKRLPVDFALVFDRSGSMTGEPLEKAKAAAISLVDRLTDADRLAIVHFGSEARLATNVTTMDASGKALARRVISEIEADGGTNMSAALDTAREALRSAAPREGSMRRMVLLSDGQANEGTVGPGLIALATSLANEKFRLSALGLGLDFDENTMLSLADAGRGQYRYLRNADEVASALTQELSQAASTAATGVTLSLQPAEGVSIREVVSYESAQDGSTTRVGLSDIASGEFRRVVVRVRATAPTMGTRELVNAKLSYEDAREGHRAKSAEAIASAEATRDPDRVSRSFDKEAAKAGLRARWAGSMLNVARKYDEGGVQEAQKDLDARYRSFEADATAIGDEVLHEEIAQQNMKFAGDLREAPAGSPAARGVSKSLKAFAVDNAR